MNINFADLPYDVQLRIMRARAETLCANDPTFQEMNRLWEEAQHGQYHQQVTTRVHARKRY